MKLPHISQLVNRTPCLGNKHRLNEMSIETEFIVRFTYEEFSDYLHHYNDLIDEALDGLNMLASGRMEFISDYIYEDEKRYLMEYKEFKESEKLFNRNR